METEKVEEEGDKEEAVMVKGKRGCTVKGGDRGEGGKGVKEEQQEIKGEIRKIEKEIVEIENEMDEQMEGEIRGDEKGEEDVARQNENRDTEREKAPG